MLFVLRFSSLGGERFALLVDILPRCPSPPFKGSLLHSLSYHISHQNGSFTQLPELPEPTWPLYACVCLRMQWLFLIMSLCIRIFFPLCWNILVLFTACLIKRTKLCALYVCANTRVCVHTQGHYANVGERVYKSMADTHCPAVHLVSSRGTTERTQTAFPQVSTRHSFQSINTRLLISPHCDTAQTSTAEPLMTFLYTSLSITLQIVVWMESPRPAEDFKNLGQAMWAEGNDLLAFQNIPVAGFGARALALIGESLERCFRAQWRCYHIVSGLNGLPTVCLKGSHNDRDQLITASATRCTGSYQTLSRMNKRLYAFIQIWVARMGICSTPTLSHDCKVEVKH